MVKKLLLILLVIAPLSLLAQDKYAYVNTQEVINKMPELGDIETKLVAKQESIRKTIENIQKEYNEKLELIKDTVNVSASVLQDRYRQLEQIQERYETFMQNSQTEYKQEQERLFAPIQQKVQQAIKDVGDANNYTYIFDFNMLIYKSPKAVDATQQVKTKLGITN